MARRLSVAYSEHIWGIRWRLCIGPLNYSFYYYRAGAIHSAVPRDGNKTGLVPEAYTPIAASSRHSGLQSCLLFAAVICLVRNPHGFQH